MTMCNETGCESRTKARGLCSRHYQRAKYHGTLDEHARSMVQSGATLDERLRHHGWDVSESDCWVWRGSLNGNGYGQLAVGSNRPHIASRVAYEAWVGPIVDDEVVCHRCDNPPCINPDHLFVGDRAANNRDMADKGRSANGELRKTTFRLTDVQVGEIRAKYASGGIIQRELAHEYGVSQQLVSHLIRGTRRDRPTNWR